MYRLLLLALASIVGSSSALQGQDSDADLSPRGSGSSRQSGYTYQKRELAYSGLEAESTFGYAEGVRLGDIIHISGQPGLLDNGSLASPAAVDANGRPTDFSGMEEQMRLAYVGAERVLNKLNSSLADVVSESLFVLDIPSAFEIGGPVRKAAYDTDAPPVASNLFAISALALPGQLIEITFVAMPRRSRP